MVYQYAVSRVGIFHLALPLLFWLAPSLPFLALSLPVLVLLPTVTSLFFLSTFLLFPPLLPSPPPP